MIHRILTGALVLALTCGAARAEPVAVELDAAVQLAPYVGVSPLGVGAVDVDARLYFVREQRIGHVQSWLLFFDPRRPARLVGTIDFGQPILGVLTGSAELLQSQSRWGIDIDVDGLFDDYGAARAMGLESQDRVDWLAGDSWLTLDWVASDPGDMVRVFSAVPEPASWTLAALALAAAAAARSRRRRRP